jgi:hypothetical protein
MSRVLVISTQVQPVSLPDVLIAARRFRPVVLPRVKLAILDPQFPVEQVELLETGVRVRGMCGAGTARN